MSEQEQPASPAEARRSQRSRFADPDARCALPDCDLKRYARGMCRKHYGLIPRRKQYYRAPAAPHPQAHSVVHELHKAVLEKKISLASLATISQVHATHLLRWWHRESYPRLDHLQRVCDVLGMELVLREKQEGAER